MLWAWAWASTEQTPRCYVDWQIHSWWFRFLVCFVSVSSQLCYDKEKKKKRWKRRRKAKAKSNTQCEQSSTKITAAVHVPSNSTIPTDVHHGPESQAKNSSQTLHAHSIERGSHDWSQVLLKYQIRQERIQFMVYPTSSVMRRLHSSDWKKRSVPTHLLCRRPPRIPQVEVNITCHPLMSLDVKVTAQILVLLSLIMQLLFFYSWWQAKSTQDLQVVGPLLLPILETN